MIKALIVENEPAMADTTKYALETDEFETTGLYSWLQVPELLAG